MDDILVTGSDGYIGRNLVAYLRAWDDDEAFMGNIYGCDCAIPSTFAEHVKSLGCIIHLAALPGVAACHNNPGKAILQNLISAEEVFKISMQTAGLCKVIFMSSQAAKNPTTSHYAMLKWQCEQLAVMYNRNGANITVLRLSNVYGGMDFLKLKDTVIARLVRSKGHGFVTHGAGLQLRNFIHVDDVCEGIISVLDKPPKITDLVACSKDTVNICELIPMAYDGKVPTYDADIDPGIMDVDIDYVDALYNPKPRLAQWLRSKTS